MSGGPAPEGIPGLLVAAERRGERPALDDGESTVSYSELVDGSRRFGAALVASGIQPGDRVAIWAPNSPRWVVALLGLSEARAVLVPINTRFKGFEAADVLVRSRARALVTVTGFLDTDYVAMLRSTGASLGDLGTIVVAQGHAPEGTLAWDDFIARADGHLAEVDRRRAAVRAADVSDILFTSGTTGSPKGVVMTHDRTLTVATDWVRMTGLGPEDRYLMVNPYFHMFGLKAGILASLAAGATMLPQAVFDVDRVLARVEAQRVTVLPGPPTLYQAMLDHPDRDAFDLSSLRVAVTGAADIPVELVRRLHAELPFSVIITGYGLTEAGTATGTSPGDDMEVIATTVGRPRPGFELRLVDEEAGDVPAGAPGEILLRGASVMAGYLDDPEATAAVLSPEGWLHTGDLGVLGPDGNLRIVGRTKDMFVVGGFNAYPAEIENVLLGHPTVGQVAVIGVPDERLGEVGMAFVVPTPGTEPSGDDIVAWCGERLANYKVPRRVELVDELPVNATGKVRKDALRARAAAGEPATPMTDPDRGGLASLADLRVVELGVWVAAPAAAALLADWGADVIKVEPPSGDPMRYVFGSLGVEGDLPNPAFALDNRGKRSVVLDLREEADRTRLEELLASADVFVTNLRPDALDRLDLEPEATVARHRRLVYCSVSGYGLTGEDRNRPTYDIGAFWARSGLSVQMADADGSPLNARGGIGDHVTALAAVAGVAAAVMEQRATGRGRIVEVSLLRTGAYILGWDLGLQLALGKVAGSEPRQSNQAPLMNPYRTSDDHWFFFTGLEAERHLPAVCRALGRPDLLDDPRFASAAAVRRHRTEVIAILDAVVAERPLAEWAERFDREGVWWAPARSPAEVVADPQLVGNDGFVEVDGGGSRGLRSVNGPISFSGVRPGRAAVPGLGEHTEEVAGARGRWPARD